MSNKSTKRSAASSWPPDLFLLLDRCIGAKTVPDALRLAGANVLCHQDQFAPNAPDDEWLKEAGRKGWVVITKDKRIRTRESEKAAITQAKVLAFMIISANVGGKELAEILLKALPAIRQLGLDGKRGQMYQIGRDSRPVRVR